MKEGALTSIYRVFEADNAHRIQWILIKIR